MARISGRNARLYVNITSGGTAEPIPGVNDMSLEQTTDKLETTAFGDATKTYVPGLPDAKGTYKGVLDTATAGLFTAAADGVARKFYLYVNVADGAGGLASPYWFGTATFDASTSVAVGGVVEMSGGWAASTSVFRVN